KVKLDAPAESRVPEKYVAKWAEAPTYAAAYLEKLRDYKPFGPEDRNEIRLVAWVDGEHPGELITPKVDRHRGFRLVVVHLDYGNLPSPSEGLYYTANSVAKSGDQAQQQPQQPQNGQIGSVFP